MRTRMIFVSCGQQTQEEIALGRELAATIEARRMVPFFAQDVHSPADLNGEIFRAIQKCDGFLAVLHRRGEVNYRDFPPVQRSSVWIQQEIAVLSYRMFLQDHAVPVRVYSERGIRLEGIMQAAIINPIEFDTTDEVLRSIDAWLTGHEFDEHPVTARREASFRRRIERLTEHGFLVMELIAAHCITPADFADYHTVQDDFFDVLRTQGRAEHEIGQEYHHAFGQLISLGLLRSQKNPTDGRIAMWIAKQWWDLILDELRGQGRVV